MSEIENTKTEKPARKGNKGLTPSERAYIDKHWSLQGYTDEYIAKQLNRNPATIAAYRKRNGFYKDVNYASPGIQELKKEQIFKHKINISSTDEEKKLHYKQFFIENQRSARIKKLFSQEDFDYFTDRWAEYHIQFPDMTPSEEDMLEKMIILDIRIIGNQKSMRQCHLVQDKLREELSGKDEFDPEDDKDLQILHTVDAYNAQELEINKQYTMLLKEYNEVQKSLNATREQREENQRVGAETFFDLMKKFQGIESREVVGRKNELMKIASKTKLNKLQEVHKYIDGSLDIPILNSEIVAKLNEQEKEKKDE